jgi:hypothetical protein
MHNNVKINIVGLGKIDFQTNSCFKKLEASVNSLFSIRVVFTSNKVYRNQDPFDDLRETLLCRRWRDSADASVTDVDESFFSASGAIGFHRLTVAYFAFEIFRYKKDRKANFRRKSYCVDLSKLFFLYWSSFSDQWSHSLERNKVETC